MSSHNLAVDTEAERKWEEYVDNFEEPKTKDLWATDGDWRLVGNGKVSHDWCGEHVGFLGCLNEDEHKQPTIDGLVFDGALIRHKHKSCFSYNCPVCYLSWAVQQAHDITDKLEGLGGKYGVADHIICSLPEFKPIKQWKNKEIPEKTFTSTNDFKKLTPKIVKALGRRKIKGGVLIFHGFRYNNADEARQKGVEAGWYWSPHFHILGFIPNKGEFFATIKEENKKDGYLVHLEEKRQTVFGTAWYQLNHASIMFKQEHFEVARWFGDTVSKETKQLRENSKKIKQLKKDSSVDAQPKIEALQRKNKEIKECQRLQKEGNHKKHRQKCPICGKEMVKLEYFGLRTDFRQSLQQCRKGKIPGVSYYKNSRLMFFDSIIDGKNNCLN